MLYDLGVRGDLLFCINLSSFPSKSLRRYKKYKAQIFKQGNVFLYVVRKHGAETCTNYINVSQSSYPGKIRHVIQNLNEAMHKWYAKNIPYVALLERSHSMQSETDAFNII